MGGGGRGGGGRGVWRDAVGLGLCDATGSIRYMQCSSSSSGRRALPRDGFDGGTSPSLSLNSHVFHVWSFWMIQQTHAHTWRERDWPKRIRKTEPGVRGTRSNHHNLVLLLALSSARVMLSKSNTPIPTWDRMYPHPPPPSLCLLLLSCLRSLYPGPRKCPPTPSLRVLAPVTLNLDGGSSTLHVPTPTVRLTSSERQKENAPHEASQYARGWGGGFAGPGPRKTIFMLGRDCPKL